MPTDYLENAAGVDRRPPDSIGRERSRSPKRNKDKSRRKDGGFRWKEKRRDENDDKTTGDNKVLQRGYKEHYRERSPPREDRDYPSKANAHTPSELKEDKQARKERKEKKAKKAAAVPASDEPMIIVNINDRLGTKAAIPCYASDPIKLFKAQVAARIGREQHEILLKRQGERPFKDQLTLEDYGVSNGVQLDLEVDTGD